MNYNIGTFTATILIMGSLCCIGCSIVPPKPQLTGERTMVERQIIGEYRELEEDGWVIASVKSNVQKEKGETYYAGGDRQLFRAMKIREYHKDKIRVYKNESALGEKQDGLLAYRPVPKYEQEKDLKQILMSVLNEENRARSTIFKRSLILTGKENPTNQDITLFAEEFARKQRELALKNDWVQNNEGRWMRK